MPFAILTGGGWLSIGNLQALSQLTAVLAAMPFVIATGEIDISVASVSGIGALAFLGLAPVVEAKPLLAAARVEP